MSGSAGGEGRHMREALLFMQTDVRRGGCICVYCGCTDKRSSQVCFPASQICTTKYGPNQLNRFMHARLQSHRTPPGGALNLWSFVRQAPPPLHPFFLGRESLSPHLILSASFYPTQSWQIHIYCGESECTFKGREEKEREGSLLWSFLMLPQICRMIQEPITTKKGE